MPESWQLVNDSEKLQAGETYRLRLMIRAPYTALTTGALNAAFRANAWVRGIDIDRIDHGPPLSGMLAAHGSGGMFPPPDARDTQPFPYVVRFRPRTTEQALQAGLDPRAIWALVALVATTLFALAITSKKLERLIIVAGEELRKNLKEVFNPGLVVLAFVAIIILKGKG